MIRFDKNLFRSFTMWSREPKNQKEIQEWREHMVKIYPQIEEDPDWLIKKYRKF